MRDSSFLEKTNSEVVCAACFETTTDRPPSVHIFVNKSEHQFRVQVVASCNFLECKKGSAIKAQMIYELKEGVQAPRQEDGPFKD